MTTGVKRRRWWQRLVVLLAILVTTGAARRLDAQDSSSTTAPHDVPDLGMAPDELPQVPPAPSDFLVQESSWVRFVYPSVARAKVQGLAAIADESKADLALELNASVLGTLEVRIARTFKEMAMLAPKEAPPPSYAVGVAYARLRLVILSLESPIPSEYPNLPEVFRHELAHIALHDAVGARPIPRWFNEGYAVHASGESSINRAKTLWSATLAERLLPLSQLDRGFPADSAEVSIAYAQSADFVRFLLRRQDRQRFASLITRLSSGESFESAMADAYASDLRKLEFQWREEIKKRYSYVPMFLGGGLLWVGAFVVVGIGWYRRRLDYRKTMERWAREEAAEDRRKQLALLQQQAVQMGEPQAQAPVVPGFPSPKAPVPMVEHNGRWYTVH